MKDIETNKEKIKDTKIHYFVLGFIVAMFFSILVFTVTTVMSAPLDDAALQMACSALL